MKKSTAKHPTTLELEVLKILWRDGPATVREVRDALADVRDLAYTSVLTVLDIMFKKGYVRRKKRATSFVYRSAVNRQTTTRGMLGDLVEKLFDGSPAAAALHLLETSDIDEKELRTLRTLLESKNGENES